MARAKPCWGRPKGRRCLSPQLPSHPQFVCVECLVTASMDMFPSQLRKSGRRELLILAIAVFCYLAGLFLVTEVSSSVQPAGWTPGEGARGHTFFIC